MNCYKNKHQRIVHIQLLMEQNKFKLNNKMPRKEEEKQNRKYGSQKRLNNQPFQQSMLKQGEFDQYLIQQFSKLKDCFSQDNCTNIGNLQRLNVNLNTLFDYVRDGFRCMINKIQQHTETINELKKILSQYNIPYKNKGTSNQIIDQMEQINKRIMQGISYKTQISHHASNFKKKKAKQLKLNGNSFPTKKRFDVWNKTRYRQQSKNQYNIGINFVNQYLRNKLEYDPDNNCILPKNSILNLYVQWIENNVENMEYGNLSLIQMSLTNQLKRIFPKIQHNHKIFKGLRFKQQYKQFANLTDVEIQNGEDESEYDQEDSPPLPIFQEQD